MDSVWRRPSGLFVPGVALMPEDFPHRLTLFKEATGLSWEGLASYLGVDGRQMRQWRRGAVPLGGAMLSLVGLSTEVPEGLAILLNRDVVVLHRVNRHGVSERRRSHRMRG